jgi:hypothetical protein
MFSSMPATIVGHASANTALRTGMFSRLLVTALSSPFSGFSGCVDSSDISLSNAL